MKTILYLFHHIHHNKGEHEVHHCGGAHKKINSKLNYSIKHCLCGKHSIDKKTAVGHSIDFKMGEKEIDVEFFEKCPQGGWHIESGEFYKSNL